MSDHIQEFADIIEQFPTVDDHVGYVMDTSLLMAREYAQASEAVTHDRALGIAAFEEFDARFSQLQTAVQSLVYRLKESTSVTTQPTVS